MAPCILSTRPSSWLSAFLRERLRDGGADLRRRRLPAQIGRLDLAVGEHAPDGGNDAVVRGTLAEVIQHHRAGPDRADRIGDALTGDVRRRAVNRLEHRRRRPLGIDVAARRDAEAA